MEKKKNDILPDEVLYINQGNLAYLRGDTKDLANKEEVFRNIAWSAGSSPEPSLIARLLSGFIGLGFGACTTTMSVPAIIVVFTRTISKPSQALYIAMFFVFLLVGIGLLYGGIRYLIYRPEKIQKLYTELTQYGDICNGYVKTKQLRYRDREIYYSFTSPSGNSISGKYRTNFETVLSVDEGASIVVLYLNDKTHVLL